MEQKVNILNLEDAPNDAELNEATLLEGGIACEIRRVETRQDFLDAIERETFDVILADYSLPSFDGLSALTLARERYPDIPFIFVSGALGEEVAIQALKNGATDYVLKDKLSRLAPAVRRALNERKQKRERENAENAQRKQSEFLRNVFESLAHPFYVVDVQNYEVIMANSATYREAKTDRSYCYTIAHHIDHPCSTADHPCPLERIKATKLPTVVEHTHLDSNGTPRIIEVHSYPILDENGEVTQMIEYCMDITERRRLERAMRSILEGTSSVVGTDFFRELVLHLANTLGFRYVFVAVVQKDGAHARTLAIWAGDEYADNIEYALEGTPCEQVWREGFCCYQEGVQQLFPTDKLLTQLGVESYLGMPLRASTGELLGHLAAMDDKPIANTQFAQDLLAIFCTRAATELERQSAEQTLARLATIVEQAAEDIVITDNDGRITYVNPAFERTLGYTRAEVEGRNARSVLLNGEQDSKAYWRSQKIIVSGGTWTGRITNRRKDGKLVDEDVTVSSIRDPNGKRIGYVAIMRDITDHLKLEAQLRQAQKMEAIGTLAGGIAHDFNNILAAISGNLDLATQDAPDTIPALRESLEEATKATERATDLVRQILAFSRHAQPERKIVCLNPLIKEVSKLLRASIPATIEIKMDLAPDPIEVRADVTQVHQILMNLCTNAYHAMRDRGGVLTIELAREEQGTDASPGNEPDPCARLTVSDTGVGMDEDIMSRIFDPFFTTKTHGEGTGLGLSVVHGIVESHGGSIRVSSKVGKGSTFDVFLPLRRGEQPENGDSTLPISVTGHGERILLVDDDEAVLESTQRRLTRLGYRVLTSGDARHALVRFSEGPEVFDLVITDQTMPHLTGLDMAAEMLRLRPSCPIILCTGYGEWITRARAREKGISELLRKPIKTHTLAKAIDFALGARRAPNR